MSMVEKQTVQQGQEKKLDLEDVPQLAHFDSVRVYSILESKLVEEAKNNHTWACEGANLHPWKENAQSAVYVLLDKLASYVGPYLIDTFVQFLNGQEE
ncbi:hypothetical protein LIER_06162 [Lithospermum erythrorhizon]|uniref:Uncharacterized protein n=1 Tax=Lithospermum erythrorhizon TaxID=34254 RepID=A0AAV3P5X1_LITER